jgi:GNAT superfamily N-acetyltransferase
MLLALTFRGITRDDVDQLAVSVADAFAAYRAFAPADWEPPTAEAEGRVLERWIAESDFWGEITFDGEGLVGHATFISAASHSFRPAADLGLAHLGHLFVTPEYWGSGAATQLLARATGAAAARGFTAIRLFVPVGQSRARRFYERERFSAVDEPFEFGLGLPVLEYRCSLAC